MADSKNPSQQSLGEYLRREREERGMTIEQVASATKIGVRLLHALEADHYIDLPAKPFIRGFVTSYCRFVGIDPKEVLTQFGSYIDSRALERPSRDAGHSGYAFEKREGEQSRLILASVLGGFVVIGGVLILVLKPQLHHHHGSHLDKLREAHAVVATPSPSIGILPAAVGSPVPATAPSSEAALATPQGASPTPNESPSPGVVSTTTEATTPSTSAKVNVEQAPSPAPSPAAPAAEEKPDPLNSGVNLKMAEIRQYVKFKALERVWVRYQVDERPVMKIVLRKEGMLILRARQSILFQTSAPQALSFNAKNRGFKSLTVENGVVVRRGMATLYFPPELAKKIEEPFADQPPLPVVPVASPDSSSPTSVPQE